jgi:hypothetical protein
MGFAIIKTDEDCDMKQLECVFDRRWQDLNDHWDY